MHEKVGKSIDATSDMYMSKFEEDVSPSKLTAEYREAIDIFPALHKYKAEHNLDNFKKLCVEITEFCRAVYASTQNDKERQEFVSMLDKLK